MLNLLLGAASVLFNSLVFYFFVQRIRGKLYISRVTSQALNGTRFISRVICHALHVTRYIHTFHATRFMSRVSYHVLSITRYMPPISCHALQVTHYLSRVIYNALHLTHDVLPEKRGSKKNSIYYYIYVALSGSDMVLGITALTHALMLGRNPAHLLIRLSYVTCHRSRVTSKRAHAR